MTRILPRHPHGLEFELLESRVNPAFFTARTDLGPVQWSNPAAWSDDPASTAIPGQGDTVFVQQGNWDVSLGDGEVVVDKLITQWQGDVAAHAITFRNGTLRFTEESFLGNHYTDDYSAPPLALTLDKATLVAGAGSSGALGQIVVNSTLRMDGLAALEAHLSVAVAGLAEVYGCEFKSVTVDEYAELLTFGTRPNVGGLRVGLVTGSLVNHGTFDGVITGAPGFLSAADMINHGSADLSGGAYLSGDLVNHGDLRVSVLTVNVTNFTNSDHGKVIVDGQPLAADYVRIQGRGTAKLDGTVYVERMGESDLNRESEPEVADFLAFPTIEGRFQELETPAPDGQFPSSGLRDPDAKQFIGLDYESDRVRFSLIDYPLAPPYDRDFDPTAKSDATGLVMVFGGWDGVPNISTASRILPNIPAAQAGLWDVLTIDWSGFTVPSYTPWSDTRQEDMQNGYDLGQSLAYWFRNQGLTYTRYHVYGYSMGSWAADGFTDALVAMELAGVGAAPVHLTLVDSYVPQQTVGVAKIHGRPIPVLDELGDSATWAEQYVDFRDIGDSTDQVLPNAYNINIQTLDDGRPITRFPVGSSLSGVEFRGHIWADAWYNETADVANGGSDRFSHGWGFRVAPEFAGTSPSFAKYMPGQILYLPLGVGAPVDPYSLVRTTAVGAGAQVFIVGPDGKPTSDFAPFGAAFAGEVRTAAADFNGDGVADIVAGTGPGGATRVRVLDGKTMTELFSIDPFEASFTGGVYVAAGDLDGDGLADLVITPDEGGGPRARVFSGKGFTQLADFFGIEDVNFRGGARPAIGDITGDGKADLVVAAGFGGGPRVGVFDGAKIAAEGNLADQGAARWNTWKPFGDFLAFEAALRNGTFVAVGDLDGDTFAELIAGGGPGGGPRVTAFSGKQLLGNTQTALTNFFAGDVNNRGGVRVSVKKLDDDTRADLVVGAGTGGGSRVTGYLGTTLLTANPTPTFDFDALTGFAGGVFVG